MAIAYVSTGIGVSAGAASSQATSSFSASASNGLIFAVVNLNGSATINSVTCTDGAMTLIDSQVTTSDVRINTYYFLGVTSTTQTVTANTTGGTLIAVAASSYSGVKQTAQPDAHTVGSATTGTSFSQSLTTVADNCWIMWGLSWGDITGGSLTAGANTTLRQNNSAVGFGLADTNGVQTPAGSKSMNVSKTGNDKWASAIASFAPATAAAVNSNFFTFM